MTLSQLIDKATRMMNEFGDLECKFNGSEKYNLDFFPKDFYDNGRLNILHASFLLRSRDEEFEPDWED
jgi:hypothetical protein